MLTITNRLFVSGVIAGTLAATPLLTRSADAQNQNQARPAEARPGEDTTRIAVVRSSDVYVRCGAAESYYPFMRLNAGDLVKITGEKFEWSRVMTTGPAFAHAFGYIKYAKTDTSRVRLSGDGASAVTLGKIDIIAPNLDTKNNPRDSWKSLVRLDADQTLRVIEAIDGGKDMILKVALPEYAQGWVSTAYLDPATPEQVKQWHDTIANPKPSSAQAGATSSSTGNASSTAPPRSNNTATASKPANTESATSSTATASATTPPTRVITTNTNPTPAPLPNEPVAVTMGTSTVDPGGVTPAQDSSATTGAPAEASTTPISEDGTTSSDSAISTSDPNAQTTTAGTTGGTQSTAAAEKPRKLPTWEDLEAALKLLQKEPLETAEVGPLRELYLDLARRSTNDARIARYATGRAEQLKLWAETQQKRSELEALRQRARMSAEEAVAVEQALLSSAQYVAVGRVAASTIYDGQSLPKLLRLQEAATGRTIAYLQPDEHYEVVKLIGSLVGIVGDKTYDGTIRLNIITPKRIDILTPEQTGGTATVTAPTDTPAPQ